MRSTAIALATILLGACTSGSPVPPAPGVLSGYFTVDISGNDRLAAYAPGTGLWVELEEEAYTAVFRVTEGEGAVLLWPYSEESPRSFPAGRTPLPELTSEEERILRWRSSFLFPAQYNGPRGPRTEELVLVVASSRPLSVDRYLEDHQALRRDLAGDFIGVKEATQGILNLLVDQPQGHNWAWACSGTPYWCRGR